MVRISRALRSTELRVDDVELNEAARAVWTKAGFEVRPIDCTSVFEHFGCLHCLVNVLRRDGLEG